MLIKKEREIDKEREGERNRRIKEREKLIKYFFDNNSRTKA